MRQRPTAFPPASQPPSILSKDAFSIPSILFQGCCCSSPATEKWEPSCKACGTSSGTRQEQISTCTPLGHQHGWVLAASLPRAQGALAEGVPLAQELVFAVVIHLVLFHPAGGGEMGKMRPFSSLVFILGLILMATGGPKPPVVLLRDKSSPSPFLLGKKAAGEARGHPRALIPVISCLGQ